MTTNDKFVLVVNFAKINEQDDDQNTQVILDALRDAVDELEVWCEDEDHEDETSYGFDVVRADVVDADVVEADVS